MLRAVIYARVSSEAQRERQTIASQLATLPPWIASQGWTLARPADAYVDDGRTAKAGKLDARTAFTRLLADAAAGAFDVVAVVDLDRLTRSDDLGERGAILGAFQRAGVHLAIASTGQVLDLRSSSGDLLSTLGAFFAAEENRKRRERTVRGKLTAIAAGRKPSGPTPYGLRYDRAAGWSVDPVTGPVVREIFERVAAGESCHRLALILNERGAPRARNGAWSRSRVHQLVIATTARGEWIADVARRLIVPVPAIVDADLWHRAQEALRRGRPRTAARDRAPALLEGIAICGICGAKVGINRWGRLGRSYVCGDKLASRASRVPRAPGAPYQRRCPLPARAVAELDAEVWARLTAALLDDALLERELAARAAPGRDHAAELAELDRRLARLGAVEEAVLARFRRGVVSERALDVELGRIAGERALLRRTRADAETIASTAARAGADVASARATIAELRGWVAGDASPRMRQALVRQVVGDERVTLRADGGVTIPTELVGQLVVLPATAAG